MRANDPMVISWLEGMNFDWGFVVGRLRLCRRPCRIFVVSLASLFVFNPTYYHHPPSCRSFCFSLSLIFRIFFFPCMPSCLGAAGVFSCLFRFSFRCRLLSCVTCRDYGSLHLIGLRSSGPPSLGVFAWTTLGSTELIRNLDAG